MSSSDETNIRALVGSRVAAARLAKGWTQVQLAEAITGTPRAATAADWEAGRRTPDADTLTRIARALGVSGDYLLGLDATTGSGGEDDKVDDMRGDGSVDLWRHIDATEANPALSEVLKILKLQEIAAAIRAEAMNNAEWAARIRAEALRVAEAGTLQRSEAIKAEAESAAARVRHIPTAPTELTQVSAGRPLTAEEKERYGGELPQPAERGRKAGRG